MNDARGPTSICDEMQLRIIDALPGEPLDHDVAQHLASCRQCAQAYERTIAVKQALTSVAPALPSRDLTRRLSYHEIGRRHAGFGLFGAGRPARAWVGLATAAVAVVVLVSLVLRGLLGTGPHTADATPTITAPAPVTPTPSPTSPPAPTVTPTVDLAAMSTRLDPPVDVQSTEVAVVGLQYGARIRAVEQALSSGDAATIAGWIPSRQGVLSFGAYDGASDNVSLSQTPDEMRALLGDWLAKRPQPVVQGYFCTEAACSGLLLVITGLGTMHVLPPATPYPQLVGPPRLKSIPLYLAVWRIEGNDPTWTGWGLPQAHTAGIAAYEETIRAYARAFGTYYVLR